MKMRAKRVEKEKRGGGVLQGFEHIFGRAVWSEKTKRHGACEWSFDRNNLHNACFRCFLTFKRQFQF